MDVPKENQEVVNVSVLIAKTPIGNEKELTDFTKQLVEDSQLKLEDSTGASWDFHVGTLHHLDNTNTRRPDDFLRDAFLIMVQSSCDLVLVITDAPLVSESQYMVPGLAAPESQVMVISTNKRLTVPVDEPARSLDAPAVRWNAATLLLHLTGHLSGLKHQPQGLMAPFEFEERRRQLPDFSKQEQEKVRKGLKSLRVCETPTKGKWNNVKIHLKAFFDYPAEVMNIAWRSKAPLLPLSLTKLTTAAIAPAIIMFFTDEFWWVGIHRNPVYIWIAAVAAILAATFYIPYSQDLLCPHREKRVITSNVAIANLGMLLTLFFMVIGLFVVVALGILLLEVWLFPPEMIRSWFKDFGLPVTWLDHLRIAVVVATLGTLTGALGSGFHGQEIIRAVSFFKKES